jgi:hypothetical protein
MRNPLWPTIAMAVALVGGVQAYEREDYEEPAGQSASFQLNPVDQVYALNAEDGTWLANTPVFGQFFISFLWDGLEDNFFTGVGMMFRLMPHWDLAPFVGVGASYNHTLGESSTNSASSASADENSGTKTDYFWGLHAEGGLRYWFSSRQHFVELFARQTWNTAQNGQSYITGGIGYGQRW